MSCVAETYTTPMDMDIYGNWRGTVVYGPDYGPWLSGREVYFELELAGQNGHFTGKAWDTGGIGAQQDIAEVEGYFDGEVIHFLKQDSVLHILDPEGNVFETPQLPGPEITYMGLYDPSDNSFSGEWEIVLFSRPIQEGWYEETCGGTWHMCR